MIRNLLSFFLLAIAFNMWGQEAALENNLAINYKFGSWKFNTSLGHRSIREKVDESSTNRLAFLEVNQFVTRKISPRLSVSIGYKYRDINNDSNEIEQRLTQQAAWTHRKSHVRLVSRLRFEQRFRDRFVHRYRYRFSLDMPLSGLKLDPKEFYLVASNELVMAQQQARSSIENRLSFGLGYVFSKTSKFQVDITHRMEDLSNDVTHIPFLTTTLLFNVN